jgi:hypothetical protein
MIVFHRNKTNQMLKLPDKPAIMVSELRASIEARFEEIQAARAKGYSADQIAEALAHDGIKINGPTLRSYIQRIKARQKEQVKPVATSQTQLPAPPRFQMRKGPVK